MYGENIDGLAYLCVFTGLRRRPNNARNWSLNHGSDKRNISPPPPAHPRKNARETRGFHAPLQVSQLRGAKHDEHKVETRLCAAQGRCTSEFKAGSIAT